MVDFFIKPLFKIAENQSRKELMNDFIPLNKVLGPQGSKVRIFFSDYIFAFN